MEGFPFVEFDGEYFFSPCLKKKINKNKFSRTQISYLIWVMLFFFFFALFKLLSCLTFVSPKIKSIKKKNIMDLY